MSKKYDIIYSIGRDCACAMYMRKTNLRICSGPFDWLTNASFEKRFELMLNNFTGFLDKDKLKPMPKPTQFPYDKNNDYYENVENGFYFWHDFPKDIDFDKAYDVVKTKYDRRIKRFYDNIKNKERVLLIWFSQLDNTSDETVEDCCNRLCQKFGKTIDFLIIEHSDDAVSVNCRKITDNVVRYNCNARMFDANGVSTTMGNEQLVRPIYEQYRLHVPFIVKAKSVALRIFVRLVCCMIPIKNWRKAIRKYFNNKF